VYPEVNTEVAHDRRRSHLDDLTSGKTLLSTEVTGHRPLHRLNAQRSISSPSKTAK